MDDDNIFLEDPLVRIYLNDPLSKFSVYTSTQVKIVNALATKLQRALDSTFVDNEIDGMGFQDCYGYFWLWVLGTYEIVRTMERSGSCFTPDLLTKLRDFKRLITPLRIVFAKQEYKARQGEEQPIHGEASVTYTDIAGRDLGFDVKGVRYYMRPLTQQFADLMKGITQMDILKDHRQDTNYRDNS